MSPHPPRSSRFWRSLGPSPSWISRKKPSADLLLCDFSTSNDFYWDIGELKNTMRSCGYVQVLKTALSQVSPRLLLWLKKMHIRMFSTFITCVYYLQTILPFIDELHRVPRLLHLFLTAWELISYRCFDHQIGDPVLPIVYHWQA